MTSGPQATNTDLSQVSVTVEATPNPTTMKFRFSAPVVTEAIDFTSAQEAEDSPLASKIFGFPWTSSVFLAPHFISVSKQDWVDWDFLAEPLAGVIRDHLAQKLPVFLAAAGSLAESTVDENDSPFIKKIKQSLDREIRPIVAYDGGDVLFEKWDGSKLYLRFKGACAGCPSKSITLKEGIEVRLKELYPEIHEVVGI
jgi:Fe-S cluster biogenesis protein NfuA